MRDSILESLHVISIPTKTNFRSIQLREFALFEGPQGWGEFSPFLEYGPSECVPWLVSGIEAALVEAPKGNRTEIDINATLPCVNGREEISRILSWFPGCKTVKIKVGNDLEEDLARIATVREILPEARIRIDVNGSWTVVEALRALRAIDAGGSIEYVEQPCATVEELRTLKMELGVPVLIAGDEIVRKSANPLDLDLDGAVDILMLKVAPLGGIKRSMEIASAHGLPVVVSSALDSAVGISYGLKLAAALPHLDFACGLGTGQLLTDDIGTLPIKNGKIEVQTVVPSLSALREHEVSSERLNWWRERIRQTWDAGAAQWVATEGWHW
ncbi:MAG: o-succinylbenzoate synthase [Candidatus Nanopelagicaceae bacterium]|nr:o-succinylbenzoate synthase [Candidatus Nanopelagicaceae bacterium]